MWQSVVRLILGFSMEWLPFETQHVFSFFQGHIWVYQCHGYHLRHNTLTLSCEVKSWLIGFMFIIWDTMCWHSVVMWSLGLLVAWLYPRYNVLFGTLLWVQFLTYEWYGYGLRHNVLCDTFFQGQLLALELGFGYGFDLWFDLYRGFPSLMT